MCILPLLSRCAVVKDWEGAISIRFRKRRQLPHIEILDKMVEMLKIRLYRKLQKQEI